ncbi:MAG: hypothetical protein HGA75_02970 [Thiobacillus sp.]|nr:hypothetical protein [Thiobacillus sp.]
MLKRIEIRNGNSSSIVALAVAALFMASPTVNATTLEADALQAKQPIPQPLVHINDTTSLRAEVDRDGVMASPVSAGAEKPVAIKVSLGRTCDDPWWELSGIQWLTCMLK